MPKQPSNNRKLLGLFLVGGNSSRMKQPKALLLYNQVPQWQRALSLLEPFCDHILISVQPENATFWQSQIPQAECLIDNPEWGQRGPATVFFTLNQYLQKNPESYNGILVMGCDYPLLQANSIQQLLDAPAPVCFQNPNNGKPEPLIALYTPEILNDYARAYEKDPALSPRKFFHNWPIFMVKNNQPEELLSVDTPEMYQKIAAVMQKF